VREGAAALPFIAPEGYTASKPMVYAHDDGSARILSYSFTSPSRIVQGGVESQVSVAVIEQAGKGPSGDLAADARQLVKRDDFTSDRIGDTPVALVTDYLTESGAEFGAPDKSTSLYVFQSDQYLVQVFVPKDGQAVAEKIIGSFDNGVASTALASIPEGGA